MVCNKSFNGLNKQQKICSEDCRKIFYNRKGTVKIATASVGSISEMEICCELLRQGYSVFRSISASAFCDVVAVKGKEIMLIEVRTGYKDMIGKILFPKNLSTKISTPTHYGIFVPHTKDIIIIKITDEEIKKYSR